MMSDSCEIILILSNKVWIICKFFIIFILLGGLNKPFLFAKIIILMILITKMFAELEQN